MKSSPLHLPALVSALLLATAPNAIAEVSARGTPEMARVDVKDASLEEVLTALKNAYGVSYRSEVSLGTSISGTYEGPLSQVIARLLDGMNYVVEKTGNNFRVAIVGGSGSRPIPPPAAMATPVPSGKAVTAQPLPAGMFPPPGPPVPSARNR
jgi:hypothetical protein